MFSTSLTLVSAAALALSAGAALPASPAMAATESSHTSASTPSPLSASTDSAASTDSSSDEPSVLSSRRFTVVNTTDQFIRFAELITPAKHGDRFEGRPEVGELLAPGGTHIFEVQRLPLQTNDPVVRYQLCDFDGAFCFSSFGAKLTVDGLGAPNAACLAPEPWQPAPKCQVTKLSPSETRVSFSSTK